jgi:hypothetical protein
MRRMLKFNAFFGRDLRRFFWGRSEPGIARSV